MLGLPPSAARLGARDDLEAVRRVAPESEIALSSSRRPRSAVAVTIRFRQPAPDAVMFADGQCVRAALSDYRAAPAHLFCSQFALLAGSAAFAVGVEKHRWVDATARGEQLPVPEIGMRRG